MAFIYWLLMHNLPATAPCILPVHPIPYFPFLFFTVRIHYVFCSSNFVHHLLLTFITSNPVPRTRSSQTLEHPAKRPRWEKNETLFTPPKTTKPASLPTQRMSCISHLDCSACSSLETPPRLLANKIEDAMLAAFEPFTKYITYLAEGKLDGYFDLSIQPEKLIIDLKVELPTQPMLLLHGLGENTNMEAINSLFIPDTVFVVFLVSFS